jgi:hypothetical protein
VHTIQCELEEHINKIKEIKKKQPSKKNNCDLQAKDQASIQKIHCNSVQSRNLGEERCE